MRRLDEDEVPAALHRVAKHTGGRLPPPLEHRLFEAVEAEPWLRDKALEELPEGAEGPAAEASRLFLERPGRWWERLGELAGDRADTDDARERERLQRSVARLEGMLEETKRRLREATATSAAAPAPDEEADALRERLAATRRDARREVEALRSEVEALEAKVEASESAAVELGRFSDRMRSDLRRARRERAAAQQELDELRRSPGSARMGPLELSRRLDELSLVARPSIGPGPEVPAAPPAAAPLRLPAGVRPDAADAVDWLTRCDDPVLVLVDGYNVAYRLAGESFSSPGARERLNHELVRLATVGRALRVVVVYDSSLSGGGGVAPGPRGVEVVFAAAGRLADEEIVERVAAASLPVVVVSADREVRENAERGGAMTLWADALAEWIGRR